MNNYSIHTNNENLSLVNHLPPPKEYSSSSADHHTNNLCIAHL